MFTENVEKILPKLQPNKVVIGFAASVFVNPKKEFGAFHYIGRGHRDCWLFDATVNNGFEGAYLTDVYKVPQKVLSSNKSDSLKIKNYYEKNPVEKEKQLSNLKSELDLLKKFNPQLRIIALGDFAYDLIPECYKQYTVKTSHYSKYGISKGQFLKDFRRAVKSFATHAIV